MPDDVNERIATALRVELARRKLPVNTLAEILKISRQAVSAKMNGPGAFRLTELALIAQELGVPLADLVAEHEPTAA